MNPFDDLDSELQRVFDASKHSLHGVIVSGHFQPPEILDKIADKVLAYRPKNKRKKPRKRKKPKKAKKNG